MMWGLVDAGVDSVYVIAIITLLMFNDANPFKLFTILLDVRVAEGITATVAITPVSDNILRLAMLLVLVIHCIHDIIVDN